MGAPRFPSRNAASLFAAPAAATAAAPAPKQPWIYLLPSPGNRVAPNKSRYSPVRRQCRARFRAAAAKHCFRLFRAETPLADPPAINSNAAGPNEFGRPSTSLIFQLGINKLRAPESGHRFL